MENESGENDYSQNVLNALIKLFGTDKWTKIKDGLTPSANANFHHSFLFKDLKIKNGVISLEKPEALLAVTSKVYDSDSSNNYEGSFYQWLESEIKRYDGVVVKIIPTNCDVAFHQKIIFGPPGTGKSHSVDAIAKSLCIIEPACRIQTVFHPEYTYGDFIAKLMPISIDGTVQYRVVAGHFIKALAKALKEPKNVLLQLDEINRGNCAAIFGDIFQLLDRDSEGNSSYSIQLSELALRALAQELVEKNDDGSYDEEKLKNVISEHTKGVKIPKNLSIVATMNTSDESVYFMDSAFKRRWQFQYIDADHDSGSNEEQVNACVVYQDDKKTECTITWNCLRQSINLFMIDNAKTIRGIEDKQIGLWFVKANNGAISEDDITFKLMHYLWDNVFARDKLPLRKLLGEPEKELAQSELATFGQFVKLKDEFVTKVLAKCPCKKTECIQPETAQSTGS